MIAVAHFLAVSLYIGAAALAATPIARPVQAPVRLVVVLLMAGVIAHAVGIAAAAAEGGQLPITGLGPALSFAGFFIAVALLLVEVIARDASLSIVAAPLAALVTAVGNLTGLLPTANAAAASFLLRFHITLSFVAIASFAMAAAAGTIYLVERRELKTRRLDAVFRLFPPLETLDRVNQAAMLGAWVALTFGTVLAIGYSLNYGALNVPQMIWGLSAWVAISASVFGRLILRWSAQRCAMVSGTSFAAIVLLYVLVRLLFTRGGAFM